jgi:hypothetical protein
MVHSSDVIYCYRNELAAQMKFPLVNRETGRRLRVVDHIGCHYAKIFPPGAWVDRSFRGIGRSDSSVGRGGG